MALLFIEGFDVYDAASQLSPGKWDLLSGAPTFTTGRLGINKCIVMAANSEYVERNVSNVGPIIIGFGIKLISSPSAETFLQAEEGGVVNFTLQLNASRYIEVKDTGGTIRGTSTTALSVGVWYYLEVKATISNTGTVVVKLDGNTEISATPFDYMNSANAYVDLVRLRGNAGDLAFDDFYILDTTGATNNDYLGDSRIDPFFPNGDNSVQWTPSTGVDNYAMVDDAIPDGDTTYVYSATPGDIDLYEIGNMPIGTGTIYGMQVVANARKMDAGSRSLILKAKSGVTTQDSAAISLSTTYANKIAMFEDSDGAGTAWTKSLVDAAQIGIEVV